MRNPHSGERRPVDPVEQPRDVRFRIESDRGAPTSAPREVWAERAGYRAAPRSAWRSAQTLGTAGCRPRSRSTTEEWRRVGQSCSEEASSRGARDCASDQRAFERSTSSYRVAKLRWPMIIRTSATSRSVQARERVHAPGEIAEGTDLPACRPCDVADFNGTGRRARGTRPR